VPAVIASEKYRTGFLLLKAEETRRLDAFQKL